MKLTKTEEPTIQFIVDLKTPGDYEQEWTLVQTNPKVYVKDSGEIFKGDKIIIDSGIRNTIKKNSCNPLENFYNVGDKVRVITDYCDVTGIISYFSVVDQYGIKNYIGLELITEKPEDSKFRSDMFEEFTINSASEVRNHLIYSGIMSISKIYD